MHFDEFSPADVLGPLNEFEQKHSPKRMFYRGDLDLLSRGGRVSIVGSRKASPQGIRRAGRLAKMLADAGIVVTSGLARGIDTAAHTTAIESGGRTLAVIGTAIDRVYPAENRPLQELIAEQHLLVSQFAPGERTYPSSFTQRNRTMALMSDATVIIEAGEKSGTIHQGWEAIRIGRPLFILKSLVDADRKWVHEMIHYGANVLCDDSFADLVESIPPRAAETEDVFAF